MKPITIEFFHDVICSFCFPMSYRMRQLQELLPQLNIVHRSFALVHSEADFIRMFGSRANAKNEILNHWEHANQNDDLHRFKMNAMRKTSFPFPSSIKPLTACTAAYQLAGNKGYWDLFDALQTALFTKAQNIEQQSVIEACVKQCGKDLDQWRHHYNSNETSQRVQEDFKAGSAYGIQSVPCLIVDGKHKINGAISLDQLIQSINMIAEDHPSLHEGATCQLNDDGIHCQ